MSVIMFKTAVAMNDGVRSVQDPSEIEIFQFFLTGVQEKRSENIGPTLLLTTMNMLT